jgi:hypothetical protein
MCLGKNGVAALLIVMKICEECQNGFTIFRHQTLPGIVAIKR